MAQLNYVASIKGKVSLHSMFGLFYRVEVYRPNDYLVTHRSYHRTLAGAVAEYSRQCVMFAASTGGN